MNAVVTGGTGGIGRAVSLGLARDGYRVLALYGRNREAADALEREAKREDLRIECIRGDLTQPDRLAEVTALLRERAEEVHAFVHCAASGVHRVASELTAKHLRWTYEINVIAAHELISALLDRMPRNSRIVGITSPGGQRAIPYYAAVGASKGALEALFRHYAHEFAPRGIAVNCVCPGLVVTPAIDAFPDRDRRLESALAATPSGSLTSAENVAQTVRFLCGPGGSQIVGQTITIDGGKGLAS